MTRLRLFFAATAFIAVSPLVSLADETFDGHVLLGKLNCASCHQSESIPTSPAPILTNASTRIDPDYLEKFIANPHATKPGTTMPDMLGELSPDERKAAARAIADYLRTLGDKTKTFVTTKRPSRIPAKRGKELFEKVGCAACHSDLKSIRDKYSVVSLTAFLEDPLAVRPGGHMPDMKLTHWEAADLAHHLLLGQDLLPIKLREPKLAERGKQLFTQYGCAQCHQPEQAKRNFAKPLAKLDPTKNCAPAKFALDEKQHRQIAAALKAPLKEPDAETQIRLTMARLDCIACHERGDFGGHAAETDAFFTTTNINLGEQARIPPSLTGVGAKLKPAWLRKVLVSGESVRPYMNTRMPKFGKTNVEPLIKLFAEADQLPKAEFESVKDQKTARNGGFELVGTKNLACVACHTFNGKSATTLAGMELATMTSRLKENWFHLYMRNPQQFHTTTIMPNFWPGGKPSRPEILDGDTGKQINAIWQYLDRGREARTPHGIKREPIEYGPTGDEPVMLRRQYHGIGKRGIGVGYPGGINLSFDAGQGRLGSIWIGVFGEMSGVWRGQGSGNVNERTREVVRFPLGPGFAVLENLETPWPELEKGKKAPDYQFKGYQLDEKRRPTFLYKVGELEIEDRIDDHADARTLFRRLKTKGTTAKNLYLRIGAATEVKSVDDTSPFVAKGSKAYHLPKNLTISGHLGKPQANNPPSDPVIVREIGGVTELLIPVAANSEIVIEYNLPSKEK